MVLGSALQARRVLAADAAGDESAHMVMTMLRTKQPGDQARADAVAAEAKKVADRYVDYHMALSDGFRIFMPDQPQKVYHFVKDEALEASRESFDASRPSALLYEKTEGEKPGYRLVGVMYTDRFGASEEELNDRVPLSIARWHEHVNLCVPSDEQGRHWLAGDPQFGLSGSITTQQACTAAGGRFMTHLAGWMVHVYPFEQDHAKMWGAGMGDDGPRASMPGMKM